MRRPPHRAISCHIAQLTAEREQSKRLGRNERRPAVVKRFALLTKPTRSAPTSQSEMARRQTEWAKDKDSGFGGCQASCWPRRARARPIPIMIPIAANIYKSRPSDPPERRHFLRHIHFDHLAAARHGMAISLEPRPGIEQVGVRASAPLNQ